MIITTSRFEFELCRDRLFIGLGRPDNHTTAMLLDFTGQGLTALAWRGRNIW